MKGLVRFLVGRPAVGSLLAALSRGRAAIFMLHRFTDRIDGPADAHNIDVLRERLAYLRRHGYDVIDLATLVHRLSEPAPRLYKTVVFTVDDGYRDFFDLAAPVFAEFGYPVTVFVATGFIDGDSWNWWDKVEYMLTHRPPPTATLTVGKEQVTVDLTEPLRQEHWHQYLCSKLKTISNNDKLAALADWAQVLDTMIPSRAPDDYSPMTWLQINQAAASGVKFGPHTVTHPILSQVDDADSASEILQSWARLQEACPDGAVPIFCYPNGDRGSFGDREIATIRDSGFMAAMAAEPGYADPSIVKSDPGAPFAIPRMSYSDDRAAFIQVVTGLERLKMAWRS